MLFNLLDSASSVLESSSAPAGGFDWSTLIMLGVCAIPLILMMVFQRRNQKKREEEAKTLLDAIKPGNTVKTVGGICGTIVEVCDDGTFVMETGSEQSGKSFLKFDKNYIMQTDAKVETPVEEKKANE